MSSVKPTAIRKESHTSDEAIVQRPNIVVPDEGEIIHDNHFAAEDKNKWLQDLAFYEEPVTLIIDASGEENAPAAVETWNNGEHPELLINGRWYKKGAIPVGVEVTIKRKHAEQLMLSKPQAVRTIHENTDVERPRNEISRTSRPGISLSIIEDRSPRASAWRQHVLRSA